MSNDKHNLADDLWVNANELKDTLLRLIQEGNARHLIVWSEDGKKLLEIPLSGGVAIGGAMVLLAPFLAGIMALAAIAKRVRVEVIRDEPKD